MEADLRGLRGSDGTNSKKFELLIHLAFIPHISPEIR